jgi:hypothetical protein
VSGSTVTLPITEGSAIEDTGVGAMTVDFSPSATCAAAPIYEQQPTDAAPPVLVGMTDTNGATDGLVELGDQVILRFSEALDPASLPSAVKIAIVNASPSDKLSILDASSGGDDITNGQIALNGTGYKTTNGTSTFNGTVLPDDPATPTTLTVTVGTCLSTCTGLGSGSGTFSMAPAPSIQALTGSSLTAIASSLQVPGFMRLF